MGEVKDLLIESCRSVLIPLQLSVLSDRDDMGCDNIDPSIPWVGLGSSLPQVENMQREDADG